MANEASKIELYGWPEGEPVSYNVNASTGVEKGTLMAISGAGVNTAYNSPNAPSALFAGIASTDKDASNTTETRIGLWRKGKFLLTAAGTIAKGQPVVLSGANQVVQLATASGARIVGYADEAATYGDTFVVEVGLR